MLQWRFHLGYWRTTETSGRPSEPLSQVAWLSPASPHLVRNSSIQKSNNNKRGRAFGEGFDKLLKQKYNPKTKTQHHRVILHNNLATFWRAGIWDAPCCCDSNANCKCIPAILVTNQNPNGKTVRQNCKSVRGSLLVRDKVFIPKNTVLVPYQVRIRYSLHSNQCCAVIWMSQRTASSGYRTREPYVPVPYRIRMNEHPNWIFQNP